MQFGFSQRLMLGSERLNSEMLHNRHDQADRSGNMKPLYQQVRDHVLQQIKTGAWQPSDRIASENELAVTLQVSRLTVNRAMRELSDQGYLVRIAGVGTFVADQRVHGHPFRIRNIAEEIQERGHVHGCKILKLEETIASNELSRQFAEIEGYRLFHSVIVHLENGIPLQFEDRYVNPAIAPHYLEVDFTEHTPSEYLLAIAPLQEVEHVVQAVMPPDDVRRALKMKSGEPCLLLRRRTWTADQVATVGDLYYPGDRYDLSSRFKP